MTRSAPSMLRRRSRTAPTTSWWAARSARQRTRARPPRRYSRRLGLFFPPSEQFLQQALEVRVDRQLHAVEQHFAVTRHPDRREVLDIGELAEPVSVVFDVHPAELDAGKFFAQGKKAWAVLDAGIAPLRAQARHDDSHG